MRRTPGAERRPGLVSGMDEDEDNPAGVQRDGQPEREVAPSVPDRSPIDSQGRNRRWMPSASNAPTFTGSVGSYGKRGCSRT